MRILWCPECWQVVDTDSNQLADAKGYSADDLAHSTPTGEDCDGTWLPVTVERARELMSTTADKRMEPLMEGDGPWVLERVAAGIINGREWSFH